MGIYRYVNIEATLEIPVEERIRIIRELKWMLVEQDFEDTAGQLPSDENEE